jgi:hypothetical protein
VPTNSKTEQTNGSTADSNGSTSATELRSPAKKRTKSTKTAAKKPAAKKTTARKSTKKSKSYEPSDEDIRIRAYFIAERRAQQSLDGDPARDWLDARQQLINEAGGRGAA